MDEEYGTRIERAIKEIEDAEKIIVGAGAGLSAAAGLEYNGKRFTENFKPFIERYGMKDLYSSSFYPFKTQEERWAYWAKHISLNRYETPVMDLYNQLMEFIRTKDYFVITTNVDGQFEKAGIEKSRFFEVQGNYAFFQCESGCHSKLYNNEESVNRMLNATADCQIPSSLVPKCPVCGGEMDVNLRKDEYFVQDENWYLAQNNYNYFLSATQNKSVVYLELGVGYNTPGIIRYPFESMVYQNPQAALIRINKDYPEGAPENRNSAISFGEDLAFVIPEIKRTHVPYIPN